jgi:hypothetical protein
MRTSRWGAGRQVNAGLAGWAGDGEEPGGQAGVPCGGQATPGGKAGRGVVGGLEQRVAPDEGDQGEVALQARPGPSLGVAEPELLLAVLVDPLDGPALVSQAELRVERPVVEAPGEGPLRLARVTRARPLAEEPAARAGRGAVGSVDAQAAGRAPAARVLGIEAGDRGPLVLRPGCRPRRRGGAGNGRAAASATSSGRRTPNVLETWTTSGSRRASRPARTVGTSP